MSELAIGLFGFLWLLMVLGLIGGLIFLATANRSDEWRAVVIQRLLVGPPPQP